MVGEKLTRVNELDYRWWLSHLLRFFGRYRSIRSTGSLSALQDHKLWATREIRDAFAAGS